MTELTGKRQRFVTAYVRSFNATQAAIEAGYSEKTAYSQGARLLKNVEILQAVQEFLDRHAMSAAEVLYHLSAIARTDIADFVDEKGSISLTKAREQGKSNLVRKFKRKTTENSTEEGIETFDRIRALDTLAKYHSMTNRVQIDWLIDLTPQLTELLELMKQHEHSPAEVFERMIQAYQNSTE